MKAASVIKTLFSAGMQPVRFWEPISGSRRSCIELYCLSLHPDADHRVDLLRCGMTHSEGAQLTDGVDAIHHVLVQRLGVRGGLTGAVT